MTTINPNTLFIGKNFIFLDKCASTNVYALDVLSSVNIAEGAIFCTNNQFDGKGQQGNTWESEPNKNLTFSLVLMPKCLKPVEQFYLNKFISVSIVSLLNKKFRVGFEIKWPNDVYFKDKKIGGILIENSITKDAIQHAIVGVGLNVNQRDFPVELPNPTSLMNYIKSELNLREILNDLLSFVNRRYEQLMLSPEALKEEYLQNLYRFNNMSEFKGTNGRFHGEIIGIGEFGELLITDDAGHLRKYNFKEIEFVT